MARTCIFCPHKADSQEHIWSKWILDKLPETTDGTFTQRKPNGTTRTWKTRKPELTVGLVCERNCNNGWMSTKLEDPMKSATEDIIVLNNKKTFNQTECATVAAWAFKTTVLANHINLHGEPFFPVEQRRAFARNLTIPKGVQVWLARRNAGHLTATYWSEQSTKQPESPLMPHLKTLPVSPYRFQMYVCVLSIGYLLLQVVAARWTERQIADRLNFPPITQGELFNDYATPIWPLNRSIGVNWPPPRAVGNDLFSVFMNRFAKLNIPAWMT
jgi:hypothetical protein